MLKILIPLPDFDFDLTEVAVPWKKFKDNGLEVVFATENGKIAQADPLLITGVIFGQLGASDQAISYYRDLEKSPEFLNPITYQLVKPNEYAGIHLPGGHAKGMLQYLESTILQEKVLEFVNLNKIIGAICHGSIVLARTIDPKTNKSVIYKKKITALTKILEGIAYYLTSWKLGTYYRTYPEYVQDEVTKNLENKRQFQTGNPVKPMVVDDGNLLTARWPLDAFLYADNFIKKTQLLK